MIIDAMQPLGPCGLLVVFYVYLRDSSNMQDNPGEMA